MHVNLFFDELSYGELVTFKTFFKRNFINLILQRSKYQDQSILLLLITIRYFLKLILYLIG